MQELSGVPGRGSVEDALVLPKVMRVSLLVPPHNYTFGEFAEIVAKLAKKVRTQELSGVQGRGSGVRRRGAVPEAPAWAPGRRIALGVLSSIRVLANFLKIQRKT